MSAASRLVAGLLLIAVGLGACGSGADRTGSAGRGATLFRDKGCADCHPHAEVAGSGRVPIGPPLTSYRNDPAILRRWLTDPAAIKPGTKMPTLGLSDGEIADLIAFLNAEP